MRLPRWLRVGTLLGLGIAAYSNTAHVPLLFDDLISLPTNESIRELSLRAMTPPAETTLAGRPLSNLSFALKLVQPFLLKMVKTTQEHLDELYEQGMQEMMRDDFRADTKFLTVWGIK